MNGSLWPGGLPRGLGTVVAGLTFDHLRDVAVGVNAPDVFGVGWVGAAVKDESCGWEGRVLPQGHAACPATPCPVSHSLLLTLRLQEALIPKLLSLSCSLPPPSLD